MPPALRLGDDPELWLERYWDEVRPNPPWEELVVHLDASPGQFAFLDRFHVATECVIADIPEPATLGLLAAGWAALAGYVRRRRRP